MAQWDDTFERGRLAGKRDVSRWLKKVVDKKTGKVVTVSASTLLRKYEKAEGKSSPSQYGYATGVREQLRKYTLKPEDIERVEAERKSPPKRAKRAKRKKKNPPTNWLLVGGAALAAYFLFFKKDKPAPQVVDAEDPPGMEGYGRHNRPSLFGDYVQRPVPLQRQPLSGFGEGRYVFAPPAIRRLGDYVPDNRYGGYGCPNC